ncbi:iron permease [Galliscardovia ingluviei]|uniref:Iron permease n=1 Tax=Galliscardovia ingluviei TaxID=1769422 RepID=A0A8J3EYW1_9BIFI|nr:FTR1 family protein [Galliscardovia ingluviei]GGI14329.1 iron permease [Galliscardovia ingluviei]
MGQCQRKLTQHLYALGALLALLVLIVGILPMGAYAQEQSATTSAASVSKDGLASAQQSNQSKQTAQSKKSDQSISATASDYDSWSALVDQIVAQLQAALKQYQAKDFAGAASDIRSTRNVLYVASNLGQVVQTRISAEQNQSIQQLFTSAQTQARTANQDEVLQTTVTNLCNTLRTVAATLDAQSDLANPRDYAKARAEQTAQERKALDAAKVNHNAGKGEQTWSQIAEQMNTILGKALKDAQAGNGKAGAQGVNNAYYQYYEKLGFEKNVMNAISGSRVSLVESTFKEARKAMNAGDTKAAQQHIASLKTMLVQDAQELDQGAGEHGNTVMRWITSTFGQAFLILIREGLEALLVVTAIVAYLVKTNNRKLIRWIYLGVLAGLAGAGLVAVVFMQLFGGSGPQQEILEGVCALVAMVMLLYTSNWMLGKASVASWNRYIREKTQSAVAQAKTQVEQGALSFSAIASLALLSFLAVFREGAETVIFYESVYGMTRDSAGMWAGAIAASIVLLVIFVLLRFTSVQIPIGPFFTITSVLLSVLVVVFAGGGVHALIEGDVLPGIYLAGVPTSDWLGVYPYAETLIAQAIAVAVVIGLFIYEFYKQRAIRAQEYTN